MKTESGNMPGSGMNERTIVTHSSPMVMFSALLVFIISVLYFNFFGRGLLFHQESSSLFIFSGDYLRKFADRPGGMLVYAGYFLTQFYHNIFLGSLLISGMLVSVYLVIISIVRTIGTKKSLKPAFALIPVGALMLLQTRYDFQAYNLIGFLLVLSWFRLALSSEKLIAQLIITVLLVPIYYLAGSFVLVLAGLYFMYILVKPKNTSWWLPAVFISIYGIATFFIFRNYIFFQTGKKLLLDPLFLNETHRLTIYLLLLSIYLVMIPALVSFSGNWLNGLPASRKLRLITIPSIFLLLVTLLLVSYDSGTDDVMRVEKLAENHEWDKVIREQERLQSDNIVIQYYYNLALAEKGELCNRMFFAPQTSGIFSLTLSRAGEQASRAMYFYYSVGLIAEAHHLAYESMVQHGYRPENIKMLIRTELINGNYKVAERYLNVLRQTLYYGNWAVKYSRLLNRPDLIETDPELGSKLKLIPTKDFFVVADDFRNIEMLLRRNPGNRIAFEYTLAKFLLEKDIMELGNQIRQMREMGYNSMPRHIQEAVVSLVNITKEFPDMKGFTISLDTDRRFQKYFSELRSFKGDRSLIEKGLKKMERNTFWYYFQFGRVHTDLVKPFPAETSIY
jgi:hypothetical protein